MRIVCPNCSAAYDLPPERLPPGRAVRCARCKSLWTPVEREDAEPDILPLPDPQPLPPATPASEPPPEPHTPEPPIVPAELPPPPTPAAEPRPNRAPLALAWLASIAALAGLTWFAATHRAEIVHAWPASERAYAALDHLRPPANHPPAPTDHAPPDHAPTDHATTDHATTDHAPPTAQEPAHHP